MGVRGEGIWEKNHSLASGLSNEEEATGTSLIIGRENLDAGGGMSASWDELHFKRESGEKVNGWNAGPSEGPVSGG